MERPRLAERPRKGHRLTPTDPQGNDPRPEPEVWLPSPSSSLPNRTGVSSGVKVPGSPARSEPCLIALPGEQTPQ